MSILQSSSFSAAHVSPIRPASSPHIPSRPLHRSPPSPRAHQPHHDGQVLLVGSLGPVSFHNTGRGSLGFPFSHSCPAIDPNRTVSSPWLWARAYLPMGGEGLFGALAIVATGTMTRNTTLCFRRIEMHANWSHQGSCLLFCWKGLLPAPHPGIYSDFHFSQWLLAHRGKRGLCPALQGRSEHLPGLSHTFLLEQIIGTHFFVICK